MARPRLFETPEALERAIDAYVEACATIEKPVTWTGMALGLGLSSRRALDNYLEYEGYEDIVRRAKLIVEQAYELRLHGNCPTGAIFALKNMGWSDKHETEVTGNGAFAGPIRIEFVAAGNSDEA